jgi:hypothetical protein
MGALPEGDGKMKWVLIVIMIIGLGVCGICLWFLTRESIVLAAGFPTNILRAMRPTAIISALIAVLCMIGFIKANKSDLPL